MKYPNNIKKNVHKNISYANRGMDLEEIINDTNKYLYESDIAVIYKKPTPIGIGKVSYNSNSAVIDKAYFLDKSTLDYNGVYKGYYIEFEAKSTYNTTSFPLSNIHKHQIEHIKKILKHDGIVFLIISMNNNFYMLSGYKLIEFINNNERKSIPFKYIEENSYLLKYNYIKGLDYINYIDNIRSNVK